MAKIPVIVVLPRQPSLLESAGLALEGKAVLDVGKVAYVPRGVELLPDQRAVPAVPRAGVRSSLESLTPGKAEVYALRGMVDEAMVPDLQGPQPGGSEVHADPKIAPCVPVPATCGAAAVGKREDVLKKLKIEELRRKGLDGTNVAVAIMDTGFNVAFLREKYGEVSFDEGNSWINPAARGVAPGRQQAGPGIEMSHGTMCAWNVLNIAPKVTLLDYPILAGTPDAGAVIAASVMSAFLAYSHLAASWAIGFGTGQAGTKYKGLVINNSWAMYDSSWDFPAGHPGRYSDNPNHIFNRQVTSLVMNGADIIFAAGNCGAACPDPRCGGTAHTICGGNSLQDVLTLGGCDTNDEWVGYSSQGPSIPGMYKEKPDLSVYTHFQGSEVYGAGTPDTGTSTSCPVAAGCVAALRTALHPRKVKPSEMIRRLIETATPRGPVIPPAVVPAAGWNADYGHGILNPLGVCGAFGL